MRAYININQKAFIELSRHKNIKLDLCDATIFEYIYKFAVSNMATKQLIDNELFIWVSYQKIIDDNPLMGLTSKKAIEIRLNKLIEVGLLKKYLDKKQGNKTYFNITNLAYNLLVDNNKIDDNLSNENDKPLVMKSTNLSNQNSEPLSNQNYYNRILNNSNNNISAELENSTTKSLSKNEENKSSSNKFTNKKNSYSSNFEIIWNRYDKKSSNKSRSQNIYTRRWKNTPLEFILQAIDKYKSSIDLTYLKDFDGFLNGLIDSYIPAKVWLISKDGKRHTGYFKDNENLFISDDGLKHKLDSQSIEKAIEQKRFGYIKE